MCQITEGACKSCVLLQCICTHPICTSPSNVVVCVVCCVVVMSRNWFMYMASGLDSLYPIGCKGFVCGTGALASAKLTVGLGV